MSTVWVGLSGGVDSAVSAHLLKEAGHRVVGAFVRSWEPDFLPCTGAADRLSAMRVAAHLGIEFVTVDLSKEYEELVVKSFVDEYRAGRTPNPDVLCNRYIKFGALWARAQAAGADYIATGHYANPDFSPAKDEDKDQTYFLWTLTQDDLAHTLFPIGNLKKSEVRSIAKRIKLPNAERPDSQGLCFLGHVDMHEFLKRFIEPKIGQIVDGAGTIVGEHDGVWFYTLGQRIATNLNERMFVVHKGVTTNTIKVSSEPVSEARTYALRDMNQLRPVGGCFVQYRYHGPKVPAVVEGNQVTFGEPVLVAAGQSVVLYDKNGTCLGGGIIDE